MSQRVGFRVYRTAPSSLDQEACGPSSLCRYKVVKNLVEPGQASRCINKKAERDGDMSQRGTAIQE